MGIINKINGAFEGTVVDRFFELSKRGTNVTTELRGATATFLTMAYILAVNPRILADSAGPCVPGSDDFGPCLETVKREYITSTAIASMFGCFLMGGMANLPIALAPGMGLNAYFTYSVVGFYGSGTVSYEAALTAVLIEGAIFLVLALTGVRFAIIKLIPEPVKTATPAAIGAFLAHLGLQTAEGIGIVVSDTATAVTLGACPPEDRTYITAYTEACRTEGICIPGDAYTCDVEGGVMTSGRTWLGILGLFIMAILLSYKNRMAFVAGIGLVTFISWFRNTAVTYFEDDIAGNARFEYFKKVVSVEPLDKVLFNFTGDLGEVGVALVTFLYVDFLDTSGTLLALASAMGVVDEDGNFPKSRWAFSADAIATMFGSLFGLSPVTSFIESAAGVEVGSKTGLTAIFTGIFFLLSIFFAPIIASIPPWASGGALIIVGSMMTKSLAKVKWYNLSHALTAFLTVIIMPLTYSIAYGLIAGIGCYIILEGTFYLLALVGIKKPVFEPEDGDMHILPDEEDTQKKNEQALAGEAQPGKEKDLGPDNSDNSDGEGKDAELQA